MLIMNGLKWLITAATLVMIVGWSAFGIYLFNSPTAEFNWAIGELGDFFGGGIGAIASFAAPGLGAVAGKAIGGGVGEFITKASKIT